MIWGLGGGIAVLPAVPRRRNIFDGVSTFLIFSPFFGFGFYSSVRLNYGMQPSSLPRQGLLGCSSLTGFVGSAGNARRICEVRWPSACGVKSGIRKPTGKPRMRAVTSSITAITVSFCCPSRSGVSSPDQGAPAALETILLRGG